MTQGHGRTRRAIPLAPLIKWAPLLILPFSVLFFETWLNVQMRRNDFELYDISKYTSQLQQEIEDLKVQEAQLGSLDRIGVKAPDLGLIEASPAQIETVYYVPEEMRSQPYDVARAAPR